MNEDNPYAAPSANITQPEANNSTLAGRGRRLGGAVIDSVVVAIVYFPLLSLSGNWERMMAGQGSQTQMFLMWLVGLSVFLTINGVLLAQRGQTIGKLLLKMRIVSHETEQLLPFWKVYGLRYLPLQLTGLIGIIGTLIAMIDAIFIFAPAKRCLHDHLAASKVISIS